MPRNNKPVRPVQPVVSQTEVIVLCAKCDRASTKFLADDKDLSGDRFVSSPSVHYGTCNCGSRWTDGVVVRDLGTLQSRFILLERENKRLHDSEKTLKTQIEAYEKAMALMGGGPMPGMRTMFGRPY